ncbi:hypothetical protein KKA95_01645 [Patescibacteria group bacterium]|nr:hypothetical protein [Patescibacteria group bacterium]
MENELVQQAYDLTKPVIDSLSEFGKEVIGFIPNLVGALLLLLVGKFVALGIKKALIKVLQILKLEVVSKKIGLEQGLKSLGLKIKISEIFGVLAYWIIYLVFILAAVEALGVKTISDIVQKLIAYLPNVIAALLIMLIGIAVANFLEKIVNHFKYGKILGKITYFVIIVLVSVSALEQIGIEVSFFTDNVQILMAGVALAFGIAFGLGTKDRAGEFVDHFLDKKK